MNTFLMYKYEWVCNKLSTKIIDLDTVENLEGGSSKANIISLLKSTFVIPKLTRRIPKGSLHY